jgi:NAD+ kinase
MNIHFRCDEGNLKALNAKEIYEKEYGVFSPENSNYWVALGGDGFMLRTIHEAFLMNKPLYGINFGHVGFLMNEYESMVPLHIRLEEAQPIDLYPLHMKALDMNGQFHDAYAFNEISLLRQRYQAAKLSISVNNVSRLSQLVSDGVIIATPAGSTAYNFSAGGPIIPLDGRVLALTPLSPFRPRRWRGALLPETASIDIIVNEPEKRPVSVSADDQEFRYIQHVTVQSYNLKGCQVLFDAHHSLEERILREQFSV